MKKNNVEQTKFDLHYGITWTPEPECPKCGAYMKEFVTKWWCRNLDCRFKIDKEEQKED